jgi:hypothetical protein
MSNNAMLKYKVVTISKSSATLSDGLLLLIMTGIEESNVASNQKAKRNQFKMSTKKHVTNAKNPTSKTNFGMLVSTLLFGIKN